MAQCKIKIEKLKILLLLIIFFSINLLRSQVTIGKFESNVKTIVTKPEPLDSLKNWGEGIERMSDYKKYIGSDIYIPPYDKDHSFRDEIFFFTIKPYLVVLDTNKTYQQGRVLLPTIEYVKRRDNIRMINYFYRVKTNIYKPVLKSMSTVILGHDERWSHNDTYKFELNFAHTEGVFNNYYTIIDVFYTNRLDSLNNEILSQQEIARENYRKDLNEWQKNNSFEEKIKLVGDLDLFHYGINLYNEELVFKMINKDNGDTVYCLNRTHNNHLGISDFVLVPYFVKHKEIYEGKNLIFDDIKRDDGRYIYNSRIVEDFIQKKKYENDYGELVEQGVEVALERGSKWKCVEVTLLRPIYTSNSVGPSRYSLHFILSNDKGQTIALSKSGLYGFILEEDYIERNKLQKLSEAEKKAKENEENIRVKEAKKERHKILEGKYGKENADLIINHKIDLNMTKEMVISSWGKPYNSSLLIEANLKIETFYYPGGYILQFENNKLIRIIK